MGLLAFVCLCLALFKTHTHTVMVHCRGDSSQSLLVWLHCPLLNALQLFPIGKGGKTKKTGADAAVKPESKSFKRNFGVYCTTLLVWLHCKISYQGDAGNINLVFLQNEICLSQNCLQNRINNISLSGIMSSLEPFSN